MTSTKHLETLATCRTCGKPPSFQCREHFTRTIRTLKSQVKKHKTLRGDLIHTAKRAEEFGEHETARVLWMIIERNSGG